MGAPLTPEHFSLVEQALRQLTHQGPGIGDSFGWLDAIPGGEGAPQAQPTAPPAPVQGNPGTGTGSESDGPAFGVPEPSYTPPELEPMPQQGFLQSALMNVLSNMPMFMPERGPTDRLGRRGKYPSGFDRFAGVAGPLLARGVGGAIEGGLKSRQAAVNAKNAAATAKAKANFEVKAAAYPELIGGAQRASEGKKNREARLMEQTISEAGANRRSDKDNETRIRDARLRAGGSGMSLSDRIALARIQQENPRAKLETDALENDANKQVAALQAVLSNTFNAKEKSAIMDKIVAVYDSLANKRTEVYARYGIVPASPPENTPAPSGGLAQSYVDSAKATGLTYKKFADNVNNPSFRKQLVDAGVDVQAMLGLAKSLLPSGERPLRNVPVPSGNKDTGR